MNITVTVEEVMEKGCIDVEEALRILGCGKTTFYQLLRDRVIPCVRVNSKKSIPVAAIEKYIAARLTQQ